MRDLERRAISLGITEEAVNALFCRLDRPLMERVCDFAEGILAKQGGRQDER